MNRRARILVDECLSRPALHALGIFQDLGSHAADLAHQLDVYGEGADDREWVPKAASDGWTVVTADRGTHSRVEAKLPLLCEAYGVTHILMAGGLSKRRMDFRVLTIEQNWVDILAAAAGPVGAKYSLQLTGEATSRLVLLKTPEPDDIPKKQKKFTD